MDKILNKIQKIESDLNSAFLERKDQIHGMFLGLLSNTNVLLIGTPGTAKSMLAEAWSRTIDKASYFAWQLHQFSTPEELFGPYSLSKLEKDEYTRITTGKLPDANIAFIDEIFKCSHGNLNAMLSILNERVFYNNGKPQPIDLLSVIGASNEVPEDGDKLEAFMDRFALKYVCDPIVENENFSKMLTSNVNFNPESKLSIEDVRQSQNSISNVTVPENIVSLLIELRTKISSNSSNSEDTIRVTVSDRMFKLAYRIMQTEAFMQGRDYVIEDDIEILKNVLWSDPADNQKMYSLLLEVVNPQKDKIMQIFYDAEELYTGLKSLKKSAKTDKQKQDIEPQMYETIAKIRDAKSKICDYIKEMVDSGRNPAGTTELEAKLEGYLSEIYEKDLGVSGFGGYDS